MILELLRVAMVNIPNTKGFIVDGFPREMEQGKEFENEVSMTLCLIPEMCCILVAFPFALPVKVQQGAAKLSCIRRLWHSM